MPLVNPKPAGHLLRLVIGCVLLSAISSVAGAQTLAGQYENYLQIKCENMNFERGASNELLPGQAGPNLFNYCTGSYALPSGEDVSTASFGTPGAATSAGSRDEAAMRRRRDRARGAANADPGEEQDLLQSGGLSLFLSLDYLRQQQKPTDYQDGRNADSYSASLGLDNRFGTRGVIGAIARYARQSGNIKGGGDFKSHALGGVVYGSWFPADNLFVDINAGTDAPHATTRRLVAQTITITKYQAPYVISDEQGHTTVVTPPPLVTVGYLIPPALTAGTTGSSEYGANLQAGYDLALGRFSVGPRAGLRWKSSETDAFMESGATPMTLAFDKQTQTSLRSTLGAQASMIFNTGIGVFVTQANIDAVHEYRADAKLVSAHFAEDLRPDPSTLRFLTQAPDRDFLEARLSLVTVLPHGASIFVSVGSNFGNSLVKQYSGTLGVRAEL